MHTQMQVWKTLLIRQSLRICKPLRAAHRLHFWMGYPSHDLHHHRLLAIFKMRKNFFFQAKEDEEPSLFVPEDKHANIDLFIPQYDGTGQHGDLFNSDSSRTSRSGIRSNESRDVRAPRSGASPASAGLDYLIARRAIDGALNVEASSYSSSRRGSRSTTTADIHINDKSPGVDTQVDQMEVDEQLASEQVADRPDNRGNQQPQRDVVQIKLEPTTSWYGRQKAAGKGWEHIYVDSWERCFNSLQVRK